MTRWIGVLVLLAGLVGAFVMTGSRDAAPASAAQDERVTARHGPRNPVIVELFTSQGCSSCPPADDVLARLVTRQPVDGSEIIALAQHVDYWNRLGWQDPFSAAEFTARQRSYARALHVRNIYTPQMIVDGQHQFVGSDEAEARRAIASAARAAKAVVEVVPLSGPDVAEQDRVTVRIRIEHLPPIAAGDRLEVLLALTEDNLVTDVRRGENRNRKLANSAVVRRLQLVGSIARRESDAFTAEAVVQTAGLHREHLKVVVFIQEQTGRRILGAGAASL